MGIGFCSLGMVLLSAILCIGSAGANEPPAVAKSAKLGRLEPDAAAQKAIMAWRTGVGEELEKRQSYPEERIKTGRKTQIVKPSGKVSLAIEFGRDGKILQSSVVTTSGKPQLDAAALVMAPVGAKFPPPPLFYGGQSVRLQVIVNFVGD